MKRGFYTTLLMALLIVLSSFTCLAASGDALNTQQDALTARLTNMLDHNYLYGNDFDDMHTVINNSCLALLESRDGDYISVDVLFPFIDAMYGIPVYCDDTLNAQFERKEGAVYIVPRGFISFRHTITNIKEEAGVLTVTSCAIDADSGNKVTCVTVFTQNGNSPFGYNIIASSLLSSDNI